VADSSRNGIVLVIGPTGSGKSTTLYTFLSALNSIHRRIVTIEDPVEHKLPGVVQIAVKPEINLTFAAGLRSILRGDPDVVMIGEIRDL
jgi:general secretion pathway protein E